MVYVDGYADDNAYVAAYYEVDEDAYDADSDAGDDNDE